MTLKCFGWKKKSSIDRKRPEIAALALADDEKEKHCLETNNEKIFS